MKNFLLLFFIIFIVTGCANLPQDEAYQELYRINVEVNRVKYVSDQQNYNMEEYFATTKEFYENGGDCEEFSLAKFAKLKELVYSTKNMWLVSGYTKREGHNVLLIKLNDGREFILDINQRAPYKPNQRNFKPKYKYNQYEKIAFVDNVFNENTRKAVFSEEDTKQLDSAFREFEIE